MAAPAIMRPLSTMMKLCKTSLIRLALTAAVLNLTMPSVPAFGIDCTPTAGPDVVATDLFTFFSWGTVGTISAYSMWTTGGNLGDAVVPWYANTNQHPVIAAELYRLKNGRMEQIGMAWVKHGKGADQNPFCTCIDPGNTDNLGVGCSDTYSAIGNGNQPGMTVNGTLVSGLGPRSEINAFTGAFIYPFTTQGQSGNSIYKRLQVHMSDLNPAQNAGAQYFAEVQYISPDDALAGNGHNNACYREVWIGPLSGGAYTLNTAGDTQAAMPAIQAWQDKDPLVTIQTADVPGEGRFILGYKCSPIGNNTWHYEYALYNLNSHRSARGFSVPVGGGTTITNIGFHDVDYHSGDGAVIGTNFDATDWPGTLAAGAVSWSTASFDVNPNANALRWGTTYNFRFDANYPPRPVMATVNLYRSGTPASIVIPTCGPAKPGDVNGNGVTNVDDLLAVINGWGPCPAPPAACPADLAPLPAGNGVVNVDDLLMVINNWG